MEVEVVGGESGVEAGLPGVDGGEDYGAVVPIFAGVLVDLCLEDENCVLGIFVEEDVVEVVAADFGDFIGKRYAGVGDGAVGEDGERYGVVAGGDG